MYVSCLSNKFCILRRNPDEDMIYICYAGIYKEGFEVKYLSAYKGKALCMVVEVICIYSQTCEQQPPVGMIKSGRCSKEPLIMH